MQILHRFARFDMCNCRMNRNLIFELKLVRIKFSNYLEFSLEVILKRFRYCMYILTSDYWLLWKMPSKKNPRPEFMLNLTSLCKNLESEVNRLELDARAALHQTKVRSS